MEGVNDSSLSYDWSSHEIKFCIKNSFYVIIGKNFNFLNTNYWFSLAVSPNYLNEQKITIEMSLQIVNQ